MVASELTCGKKKSSKLTSDAPERISVKTRSLTTVTLAILLSIYGTASAVSLAPDWIPTTNNSGNGTYTVGGGSVVNIDGPTFIQGNSSGYVQLMIEDAIAQGYASGDSLVGKVFINTGTQTKAVKVFDSITNSYKDVFVFDSNTFSQRAAGSSANEIILGLNRTSDFFYQTRLVHVDSTGGMVELDVAAKNIGSYFKDSQLAYADGTGSATSVINWNSQNNFYMSRGAVVTPADLTASQDIKSMEYAGLVTAFDGSIHHVNNVDELRDYNNWLIMQMQQTNTTLTAAQYADEFNKAFDITVHTYDVDRTSGGTIDTAPYIAPNGTTTIMTANGPNATVRVSNTGQLSGVAPSNGAILAIGGGKGINDGVIDMSNVSMTARNNSSVVNNGNIYVWFTTTAAQRATGLGMYATGSGATAINNGSLSVRPYNNASVNPLDRNIGMRSADGGYAENNNLIDLSPSAILNDTVSAVTGVLVSSGGSFTNTETAEIRLGNGFTTANNTIAVDVVSGAGTVINNGTISFGDMAKGAVGLNAENAGTVNVQNNGEIIIGGTSGDSQNVGIYAKASKGLLNKGLIDITGINAIGIKAVNGGSIDSVGSSLIRVGGTTEGLRNYGGWIEGVGSTVNLSGTINLLGENAIGLHARDGGQVNLSGDGAVNFGAANQIGFYVYGTDSNIKNTSTHGMNVSTMGSTLFRIASGAKFVGGVDIAKVTASGENAYALFVTGKDGGNTSKFTSGSMTIELTGSGSTGVLIEGGAEGLIENSAIIHLNQTNAIAGIADGNGHDLAGNIINSSDPSTLLTAAQRLSSSQDKVTGYIARNKAKLINTGNIEFTGANTIGIQVLDGSIGENGGSITVQDGGIGLIANSSNLTTEINNSGNLILRGGSNSNRTKGILGSGNSVTVNMTDGVIDLQGQGAIGVEVSNGGTVNLSGTAVPKFADNDSGITDQIAFRIIGDDASITTNVGTGTLLDASGTNSTLFRIEQSAQQTGILQMKTSGTGSRGIWATDAGTSVVADAGSDFQVLGARAQGVYITGGATGLMNSGVSVNLVGFGAVVGEVDGNEYALDGSVTNVDTGSKLTNKADITTPLRDAIGFITRNKGLMVNTGNINFTAGNNNIGVWVDNGKFDNQGNEIKVNGVVLYVEGTDSVITSSGGKLLATDGEAAIKLGNGASLDLAGSGFGIIEGQGLAHGVLLDVGAVGLIVDGARIDVNAAGATGYGIENRAEISGIQLMGTTVINVANGIGVRTSASLAQENSGTVNVDGSGIGLAFQTTTGDQIENDLDMSQSSGLVVNLNGTGGTGILANTRDGATVKSGASVNINKADGGSALVVNNFAKEVIQSGNLISSSMTAAVVLAEKANSFTNTGKIIANSITAGAMSFDGTINTVVLNDTGAEIQGVVALNGGKNNFTNKGLITGTISAADNDNTMLFDTGSTLTGKVTLGQGNNQVTLNGTAHTDEVTAGSGVNTFIIKGTGATYNLLDGGLGVEDSLVFDAATHTIAQAVKLQNFEHLKLKNQSTVILNEALILTDGGTGTGAVDIESGSEMAIKPTLAGDFVFNPLLTGAGILSAELDADTSAFNLSTHVGSGFKGTLRLSTSSFNLANVNASVLSQATLQSDSGNTTTVGTGVQNIGGLTINGGKLLFGSVMPGDKVSENSIVTSATGTLDIRGTGIVQVTMPIEVINDVPALDTRKSLFEQDDETTLVKLVTAEGNVLGNGSAILLNDENGNVISNAQTFDINQNGTLVAEGTYDYKLMNGDGNTVDGLYIGYGLTQLDLQGTADDALILTSNAGATGKASDLSAKVTGTGDLAIESGTQTVSLSNKLNDYTGDTTVRNGTLVMANDNVLGKTANLTVENGATFKTNDRVGSYSQTVGALNTVNGASVVIAEGSALTISDVQRAAGIVEGGTIANGTLSGAGELNIASSELVVNGANAGYIGDVNLSGTSLATLNGAQGLGTQGTIHFAAAGDRLDININPLSGNSTNLSKSLSGEGLVTTQNVTDLTVTGDNTDFTGIFSVETDAVLRAAEQKHLGSSVIENQGITYLIADAKWDLENTITGSGALVKQGADILVINHELAYTGETTVESGGLIIGDSASDVGAFALGNDGMLSGSSKVNVLSGAVLSGLGNITGEVDNQGTIAALNALAGYESATASNLNVGSLTNGGVIQLAGKNIGNTLTVNGDYTGGGTLVINAVLNDDSSATDKLIVTGNTSGETGVIVNNIRGKGQQTVNGIEVVNVGGLSDGTFKLNNRAVAGAYEYFLHKDGVETADGNWYLRSQLPSTVDPVDPVNPTPTDNIIRPEAGSYMANMAAASKMFNLRLEDREGRAENSSMWLRQVGSRTKFRDTTGQSRTVTNTYVVQGGAEVWGSHFNDNDRLGIGLMAAYGNASSKTGSNRTGYSAKGTVDGYSTGVYATWYQDAASLNGVYVDSWMQYSWLNGEVKGDQLSSESYNIDGLSASVETGYRMPVYQGKNSDVYVTPQAQVTWSGIKADDHREINGTRVTSSGDNNIQTRLGVKVSRDGVSDGDMGKDKLFTVYAEANWLNNSQQAGAVLNGVEVKQSGGRNLAELKLGTEGQLNKNVNLWTNVAQQLGDDGYSDTTLTVGFKYKF